LEIFLKKVSGFPKTRRLEMMADFLMLLEEIGQSRLRRGPNARFGLSQITLPPILILP
jgi:hypothetical protein